MKTILATLTLVLALTCWVADASGQEQAAVALDMAAFRAIPVLHDGRVKPMESFSRAYLLAFYGKASLPHMSAVAWMAELLFDPENAYQRDIFNVPNPDVVRAIGLEPHEGHHYSFHELSMAFDAYDATIKTIDGMSDDQRAPQQKQLLDLYYQVTSYAIISESLLLLQPRFTIEDPALAATLHVSPGRHLTFLDLMPYEKTILGYADQLKHKNPDELTATEKEHAFLALHYWQISRHKRSAIFRILPPQWRSEGDMWTSPWTALLEGHGSPQTAPYLELWKKMATAYAEHDPSVWATYAEQARAMAYEIAGPRASVFGRKLEVFYLQTNPFNIALIFYSAGFVLLMTAFLSRRHPFYQASFALMALGAVFHVGGIVMRITIMGRPPVATLYETTIFVSFIAVFLALLFERQRRDAVSLLSGAIIGMVLLFISLRYAADGDTMEMLVAVLNTNFWLATHVVAVTAGYGCSLVAGVLGHVYLLYHWRRPGEMAAHKAILDAILAVALIAAFFATLGTILGGIWADQSWGRFWGWDPKENGAMLIVLWLLWMLHGRIANVLSPLNFASVAVLTNVVVALSWFGVNLLSVGLHSYGFANGIAANLGLFCGAEILFVAAIRGVLALKPRTAKS